jgi:hypothetical protein
MAALDLRLRVPVPGLLALPWRHPLADWDVTAVAFRDIPVGPSRHLVRFVEAGGRLWALKSLPRRVAEREYAALRTMEDRGLPAVRAAGLMSRPAPERRGADEPDDAVLVTEFLAGSWQYRRLLLRVPLDQRAHRTRLLDGVAALLVDLHRGGVHWGDCSLANTLFKRDGQALHAFLVDAETAETHGELTAGQRQLDLDILTENVTGGLLDVAARRGEFADALGKVGAEVDALVGHYRQLWDVLHDEPVVGLDDPFVVESRLRRLNELGFAVDEVQLAGDGDEVRLRVCVAGRRFHAEQLRDLTGIVAGEGQATILLNDVRSYQHFRGAELGERLAARRWVTDVFDPGVVEAHRAVGGRGDPIQAYCDLLEVRWLLSEEAGADVGDTPALAALAARAAPGEAAANLAFVDMPTAELPAVAGNGIDDD